MAMIALKCPHIKVTVVDLSQPRIDAWWGLYKLNPVPAA
jgi:hypothetical protein